MAAGDTFVPRGWRHGAETCTISLMRKLFTAGLMALALFLATPAVDAAAAPEPGLCDFLPSWPNC